MNRISGLIAAAAIIGATATTVATAPPASADDQRPCVSMTEFRTGPGLAYISGRTNPGPRVTRPQLERLWEVQSLGVIDPELTDKRSSFWMYPVCGYSFDKAQIWVIYSAAGKAGAAMFWHEPGYEDHYVPQIFDPNSLARTDH